MTVHPALKRGLRFSVATGVFGASAWAVMGFLTGGVASAPVAAAVGGVFWICIGFGIGALGAKHGPARTKEAALVEAPPRRSMSEVVAQLIYRGLIGFLIATVVASTCTVAEVIYASLVFGDIVGLIEAGRDDPSIWIVEYAFTMAMIASFAGGIMGGWLGTGSGARMSLMGSFAGLLLGSLIGASLAAALGRSNQNAWLLFGGGSAVGVLGAVLASFLVPFRVSSGQMGRGASTGF
jgi:hypothetical protein